MQIPGTDTFGYTQYCINGKPRFASVVDLFLDIQVRIEPCPQICCHSDRSNVNADDADERRNVAFRERLEGMKSICSIYFLIRR